MKIIAIVAGGDSSEFEVSVKSAEEVGKKLSSGYIVYIIMIRGTNWYWEDPKGRYSNIDKNDFTLVTGGTQNQIRWSIYCNPRHTRREWIAAGVFRYDENTLHQLRCILLGPHIQ